MARQTGRNGSQNPRGLTDGEKAAMWETMQERKAGEANDERTVLAKIAEMKEPDRSMARRVHDIIKVTAPDLSPRTWYGMPAYSKDDKVVCFFQSGEKFKTRYATLGFQAKAKLDEGHMWPVAFALTKLSSDDEARIAALVRKAIG